MGMSKKHFIALAESLRFEKPSPKEEGDTNKDKVAKEFMLTQWKRCVRAVADVCASDNGAFNRSTFYSACDYQEE